ncbi:MAG TPA: hypothetical protein VGO47_05180 [Chlamydiales bacterium]|jgi:hypothetical protein|nr:hypothetical protein [Chlamydiales bacterium]
MRYRGGGVGHKTTREASNWFQQDKNLAETSSAPKKRHKTEEFLLCKEGNMEPDENALVSEDGSIDELWNGGACNEDAQQSEQEEEIEIEGSCLWESNEESSEESGLDSDEVVDSE